jgi:hypothetical protein
LGADRRGEDELVTLAEVLVRVWAESLRDDRTGVEVEGHVYPVERTRNQQLRVVAFLYHDHAIEGIEQNPHTSSRWAKLAQEGQRIMQFSTRNRYIANVCEGRLTRYPSWKATGMPD